MKGEPKKLDLEQLKKLLYDYRQDEAYLRYPNLYRQDEAYLRYPNLRYPNLDSVLNSYMQRAEKGDPKCVFVDMNGGGDIQFSKYPEKEEAIFTISLGSCLVTALVLRTNNGNEYVHLIHSDPFYANTIPVSVNAFAIHITRKENIEKAALIFVGPGRKYDEKYNLLPDFSLYDKAIAQTKQVLANTLPNVINRELAYQGEGSPDEKNQGVFRIVKTKDTPLRFIVDSHYPSGIIFNDDK